MEEVEPISVDALLLRSQLPELTLRPGASLVARVAARAESHGVLVLAGLPLTARLPDEVAAGETLRLTVTEVSAERIILRMEPQAVPGAPPPPPPAAERAQVAVDDRPRRSAAGGEERASVALSFESPALGRLDLRIDLGSGGVRVAVGAAPGTALELAGRHAGDLRETLEQHLGRRASVQVDPRREPLDLYA